MRSLPIEFQFVHIFIFPQGFEGSSPLWFNNLHPCNLIEFEFAHIFPHRVLFAESLNSSSLLFDYQLSCALAEFDLSFATLGQTAFQIIIIVERYRDLDREFSGFMPGLLNQKPKIGDTLCMYLWFVWPICLMRRKFAVLNFYKLVQSLRFLVNMKRKLKMTGYIGA